MKISTSASTLALLILTTHSLAVEYTLPNDAWYQLQSTSTYETVCQTGDTVCDVASGAYTLVRFGFEGSTKTTIVIGAGASTVQPPPQSPSAQTLAVDYVTAGCESRGDPIEHTCTATCPVSTLITGGQCSAGFDSYFYEDSIGDGVYESFNVPARGILNGHAHGNSYLCVAEGPYKLTERSAAYLSVARMDVVAQATCISLQ